VDFNFSEQEKVYIEIEPELSACVETKIRKVYNHILNQLLKEGGDEGLMEKFKALKFLLETVDFGKLRSEYERYLLEGKSVKFIIYVEEGKPRYKMEVHSPES